MYKIYYNFIIFILYKTIKYFWKYFDKISQNKKSCKVLDTMTLSSIVDALTID